MAADEIYIQSVTITPNPVDAGDRLKIEVDIYMIFPALDVYPAMDIYPGKEGGL